MRLVEFTPRTSDIAARSFPNALSELLNRFFGRDEFPTLLSEKGFYPKVDVLEGEKEIKVSADIPGIEEKNISVEIKDGYLVLSGHREEEKKGKEKGVVTTERSYGSFYREIALPDGIGEAGAKAEYKKGVLTVTIPKLKQTPAKKVSVKVS